MHPGSNDHFPMALPNGFRMDHYEIQRTLGVGNFGVTYLGYSHRFHQHCVIKELLPGDFATRSSATQEIMPLSQNLEKGFRYCQQDFLREATILHKITHPNVVKILDRFDRNGTSYYVMPYAKGFTLEQVVLQRPQGSPMPEAELLSILFPLLDGLESVHQLGYLHRDIKPENIIIRESGQPLMIDFGAARQLIASRSRPMSAILTRGYAPYEQYGSTQNQGPYTDIYALGAVLHRVITGHPPAESVDRLGPGPDPYQPLAERRDLPAYSDQLRRAIDIALIPQAKLRPQSIAAWRQHLPLPLGEAPHQPRAQPPPLPPSPPRLQGRAAVPPVLGADLAAKASQEHAPPVQPSLPPHFYLDGRPPPPPEEGAVSGPWNGPVTSTAGRPIPGVLKLALAAVAAVVVLWAVFYFLLNLVSG